MDEKIITVSMQMITLAGEGRSLLQKALDAISLEQFTDAKRIIEEATLKIQAAHIMQTEIVQSEMSEAELGLSVKPLLFTHAQDTLMTINSELIMTKKLCKMFNRLYDRLNSIEETIHGNT